MVTDVTKEDIHNTKTLLENYIKLKQMVKVLNENSNDETHVQQCAVYQNQIRKMKIALNCMVDDELREIVEHRFFKGFRFKDTVNHYANIMDERTVSRRINKGIIEFTKILRTLI